MQKNNSNPKTGFNRRLKSFGFALTGIYDLVKSEPNMRIHVFAALCAISAGLWLHISRTEWCVIIIVIGMVCMAEAFNTVIEKIADHLFPEYHETARIAKDLAAGAVLICTIVALVCGLIIFLPKLF